MMCRSSLKNGRFFAVGRRWALGVGMFIFVLFFFVDHFDGLECPKSTHSFAIRINHHHDDDENKLSFNDLCIFMMMIITEKKNIKIIYQ